MAIFKQTVKAFQNSFFKLLTATRIFKIGGRWDNFSLPPRSCLVVARWNPSGVGDQGGLETRVASVIFGWHISRSTFVVRLAECTNKELRTTREMYMRLFQTPLFLKKNLKGAEHLNLFLRDFIAILASLRRRC